MTISMQKRKACLAITSLFISLIFLVFLPQNTYASQLIYTIQTGSMVSIIGAQKQFNSISQLLNKKELNFLRIEKIGKYHTVRLGKFENHATAEKFLQEIKPRLSEAIILKAYLKKERIVRLYGAE